MLKTSVPYQAFGCGVGSLDPCRAWAECFVGFVVLGGAGILRQLESQHKIPNLPQFGQETNCDCKHERDASCRDAPCSHGIDLEEGLQTISKSLVITPP